MKINLVMIVRNEERFLRKCLQAAAPLVDGIFITDTGSTDRTAEIAREMGAAVSTFTWVNDFSAARNFALEQSDGDWNLVLDADEYVRSADRRELERVLASRPGLWFGGIIRYDSYPEEGKVSISTSILPRLLPGSVRYAGRIHEQPEGIIPVTGFHWKRIMTAICIQTKGSGIFPIWKRQCRSVLKTHTISFNWRLLCGI